LAAVVRGSAAAVRGWEAAGRAVGTTEEAWPGLAAAATAEGWMVGSLAEAGKVAVAKGAEAEGTAAAVLEGLELEHCDRLST